MSEWRVHTLNVDVDYVQAGTEKAITGSSPTEKAIASGASTEKAIVSGASTEKTITGSSPTEKTIALGSFDNGYAFRRTITIDSSKVSGSGPHTDFPFLFNTTDIEFAYINVGGGNPNGNVTSLNGYDIIFTSDAEGNVQLDHEIHLWLAISGLTAMWVRIPSLSTSVDTVIYIFYGNSSVGSSQENVAGTWSSDFEAVWHMGEVGSAITGEYGDSTGNGHAGQGGGGDTAKTPTRVFPGRIGYAQEFDTTNQDYIECDDVTMAAGPLTFSAWCKPVEEPKSQHRALMCKFNNYNLFYDFKFAPRNGHIGIRDAAGPTFYATGTFTPEPVAGAWTLIAGTYDNNTVSYLVDGVAVASTTPGDVDPLFDDTAPVTIGRRDSGATETSFDGNIQEVRIMTVARDANWLLTEYNNQNSPGTFYTLGNPDSGAIEKVIQ